MPPPPPSASYLLDINTDSEHSDDNDEHVLDNTLPPSISPVTQQDHDDAPTKKKKKRKKRRKKKKTVVKQVSFGDVSVREHERCLGVDGVPLDGGWPLGISPTVVKEYKAAETVDEFEERRQEELRDRWLQVMGQHVGNNDDDDGTLPPPLFPPKGDLETRQYDYRKRVHEITQSTKNPLFGPLDEDNRMRLLVSNDAGDEDDASVDSSSGDVQKSPNRSPAIQRLTGRTRSNSMHSNPSENKRMTRRNRSNSEQYFSENYPSTDVLHVRNELEQIRVHRTLEGSTGCTCRKLDVYLPPPDGGGKKAQHRRMKPQKVKEELRKRGKLPENASTCTRAELEQLLHDVVEQEPCCWGEECFCVKNGIGCQADACSCWFESHQRKGHNNSLEEDNPSVESIRERCGNNMYAVDLDGIHDFRLKYCPVIDAHDGEGEI